MQRPQAALELFHKMQACGQDPDPQTYAILLDGLCKNKQIDEAMAVFQEMESKRMDHNIVIYNILIDGFLMLGNLRMQEKYFIVFLPEHCGLMFGLTL